jgi:hypothetical protein
MYNLSYKPVNKGCCNNTISNNITIIKSVFKKVQYIKNQLHKIYIKNLMYNIHIICHNKQI